MSDVGSHQEFTHDRARRHRSRYWLAIGFGLAAICVSGTALAALPATVPPETDAAPEPTIAPTTTEDVPTTTAEPEPTTTTPTPTTTVAPTPAPEPGPAPTPPPAPVAIDLVPLCTSSEDIDAGTRTFRLDNNGTEPVEVTLRNVATGRSVSGTAAPGQSTWEVPAGDGANTTEVVANGQVVATSDSTNLMCGALHGHAECNPSNGTTTITWTVSNNDGSPAIVLSDSRDVDFQPNPDAPHGESTGIEVIDGPADDDEITETVTIQLAGGETSELSASVTAPACTGPSLTPDVSFTFTKTPSVPTAGVGDTIEYVYCGQNTGALPLEVVRLVDDRLGVVIELPGVETVVAPGDSLCNTDIGQPVNYTVGLADLGTTIINHAVVTVRTVELAPRVFQATATATVDVALSQPVLALLLDDNDKTWVCHRTEGGPQNPYNLINVSGSSTDASGHTNHAEDIIPPGPWGLGQNYDPANGAIWVNDCKNLEALPLAPTLIQATCQGGVVIPPSVLVAKEPLGVTYTFAPSPLGDGTADVRVTVTATLRIGYDWGSPLTPGWTSSVDGRSATWNGTLKGTSCTSVKPVLPTPIQAKCIAGELIPPSLPLPTTSSITYAANPASGYAPGSQVTVTATLSDGAAWASDIAPWTQTSATTATYTFSFDQVGCIPVTPVAPRVVAATCTGGVVVPPTVTPGDTTGVIYGVIPTDLGDGTTDKVIQVTASVLDGWAFTRPLPEGWTSVAGTRMISYTVTLTAAPCLPVTPANPQLRQAACTNGVVSRPTLTLPTTTNINYTVTPGEPYASGQTVTVTAKLTGEGVRWPSTLPTGWERGDATTATFVVTFASVACIPVSPVVPGVAQATCTGGAVVPPKVTLPTTAGITYTVDPQDLGNGTTTVTVTVTARLADGYQFGQLGVGWSETGPTTATLALQLSGASCTAVTPVAPTLTQAVCVAGVLSAPTLVLSTTDEVTYGVAPAAPYVAGQSVTVTATLAASDAGWAASIVPWTQTSPTTATLVVTFDRVACAPVTPVVPGVGQATCTGGVVVPPTVSLPTTAGITYTVVPQNLGNGTTALTVTVMARLVDGYEWGQLGGGWIRVDATTATLAVVLPGASCAAVTPAAPMLTQAVCTNGVVQPPTLVLSTTDKVTYGVDPAGPYRPGQPVTVTATLAASGAGWAASIVPWTQTSPTTATLVVTFDKVSCIPVTPVVPGVGQATCTGGVVVPPTVTLPTTAGITYTVDPQNLGNGTTTQSVTVTARLADRYEWGQLGGGWTRVDATTATVTVVLPGASCTAVTPAAPMLTQAVCTNGVVQPPTLVLSTTDKVTYGVDPAGPYRPGQPVTVTATLAASGAGWAASIVPWTQTSPTTATLVVTFDKVSCIPVSPVLPGVAQATCTGGVVVPPKVTLPTTAGITYTVDPQDLGNGTTTQSVTVTARLADRYEWGQLGGGWIRVDATTATLTVVLPGASCEDVAPAAPTVTEAVCAGGVLSAPSLELAVTDQVTYTVEPEGPYSAGDTVAVTATLAGSGVGWGDQLPAGWVEVNATTATLDVTFDDVACTPVVPVEPTTVAQATCTGGVVVPPTVTLPTTAGITYSMDPEDLGDGTDAVTVTVTAVVADGFGWGQVVGDWVRVDDTTATLTLELAGASCDEVTPAAPTVTQAVCSDGGLSAPSVALASTDDVTYTVDPAEPYVAGQSVIVTAILDPAGVAWGDAVPAGWTAVDDQTATFSVTFDDVVCVAVSPVDPTVIPPGPSTEGVVELPVTPGITYTVDTGSPPVVRAVIPDGYEWGPLPDQWTQVDETTATFTPTSAAPATPGVLAHTGPATLARQSLLAAGLLMVGFGLCGLGRRRVIG